MNKFRLYCGPTCVRTLADMMRKYQFSVTLEGTEHVYVETSFTAYELFRAVKELPFGLNFRDVQFLGTVESTVL